jgi:hypothetical protein
VRRKVFAFSLIELLTLDILTLLIGLLLPTLVHARVPMNGSMLDPWDLSSKRGN